MASAVMDMPISAPPHAGRRFAAFLFDMDGTLITSIESANRAWTNWACAKGIDPVHVTSIMHGVRTVETMRRLGMADPEAEAAAITAAEIADVAGVEALPGAAAFLAGIPAGRWAIVTSAPRELALVRLKAADIPVPPVFVTSEDVAHGKPAPDCFLLAATRLGVAAADCLVFEDTAAGLAAADAAGAAGLALTFTHQHPLATGHPGVRDYAALAVAVEDGALALIRR